VPCSKEVFFTFDIDREGSPVHRRANEKRSKENIAREHARALYAAEI
jgi:hypothetical protein